MTKRRIVIGVSGASGAPLAVELLEALALQDEIETHLVITRSGQQTIEWETKKTVEAVCDLADVVYNNSDIGASIASGSFKTSGMIVVPCSMKTVAGIATGYSDNLLLRAADVTIKERRRLVLVTRECPLSTIHLRNMTSLSEIGAIIMPPVLTYYNEPQTMQDMTRHMVGKMLDIFDLSYPHFCRWGTPGKEKGHD